jgi:CheY-like chemotaxis protein
MSAEIVRMHGGAIRCESIVGQGTRFLVELPVTQDLPPSAAPPSALPAPRPPARARVLLVDDEPLVLDFFRTVVESKHDAVALGNAEDALRLLEDDRRFDLIVCDFTMPGMSGPEFKRRTAEMDPDLAQRFIFCTGGALTEDAQLISRTNKEVLLFKPIKPDKLLFAIDKRIAELRRS